MSYTYKYPHPAVTTDCVVFGFDGKDIHILLIERGIEPFKGSWALPGGFLRMDETVEECARRELQEETRLKLPRDTFMEQFHVFSSPRRDPRERVITVAFYALVRPSDYDICGGDDAARAEWFPYDNLPPLAFDHDEIINLAKEKLKEKIRTEPIAFKLLDDKFCISELQALYQQILGVEYDKRNFWRKVRNCNYLVEDRLQDTDDCFEKPCECNPMFLSKRSALWSVDEKEMDKALAKKKTGKFLFDL